MDQHGDGRTDVFSHTDSYLIFISEDRPEAFLEEEEEGREEGGGGGREEEEKALLEVKGWLMFSLG